MGYKLKSGQTIVDDDGNLNVIHGATLYVAGDLYTNNQSGFSLLDSANGAQTGSQLFIDSNPLHVGKTFGYFAGGDVIGHSRLVVGASELIDSSTYYDFLDVFLDPSQPAASEEPTRIDIMSKTHGISKFPFAISNATQIVDHAELPSMGGNDNQNALLGAALSDGSSGYYTGGMNVYLTGPNPAPTGSTHTTLDQISKYPFGAAGGTSTDAGELSVATFQCTGHNSKNGSGYVAFTRNGPLTPPGTNEFHMQKFSFGSSATSSYVGFFDLTADPSIPPAPPMPASPPSNPDAVARLHGFAGFTDSNSAYIAGGKPGDGYAADGTIFMNGIHRFNFASESFSLVVGTIDYENVETPAGFGSSTTAHSGLFPETYRRAGISISSISDGYWIGSGNATFNSQFHTSIRKFPFANMVDRAENVEGFFDGNASPFASFPGQEADGSPPAMTSAGLHGLEFLGNEVFPTVEPGEDFPNPGWELRAAAPFYLSGTGHSSTDYGFVSHIEHQTSSSIQAGSYFAPSIDLGMESYTLKFPYANATHVIEVSESAPATGPTVLYPRTVKIDSENVLAARGMMGQTGTVS